jgi:hypothetical protein
MISPNFGSSGPRRTAAILATNTETPYGITELTNCKPTRTLVLNTFRFLIVKRQRTRPLPLPGLWVTCGRPLQARTQEVPAMRCSLHRKLALGQEK